MSDEPTGFVCVGSVAYHFNRICPRWGFVLGNSLLHFGVTTRVWTCDQLQTTEKAEMEITRRGIEVIIGLILSAIISPAIADNEQAAPTANSRYVIKGGEVYDN